jgi:CRISPR-associated protein Csb1
MAGTNETLDFQALKSAPRLLMEAELKPLQGDRFQPTGFADLGPARYTLADGTEMLLLESAQSVANRMELACCKEDRRTLLDELVGLPYVVGKHRGDVLTTSYLEAHRLSSPYLLNAEWAAKLSGEMQLKDDFQINDRVTVATLFRYDPCSLLHGVWLGTKEYKEQFSGGRVRLTRTLSGFIEAKGIVVAESGGTKFDKNAARLTETGDAETGYGTLPFHRSEFTAGEIKAYFNLDLGLLRGYGLHENATKLLITLALLKVRRFLSSGLRLRTACDLEIKGSLLVKRPEQGFAVPSEEHLLAECRTLIANCTSEKLFANPPVTEVVWEPNKTKGAKAEIQLPVGTDEPSIPDSISKFVKWKKATKSAGPKLLLPNGLDAEQAGALKALFLNNPEATMAIEKGLKKEEAPVDPEENSDGEG